MSQTELNLDQLLTGMAEDVPPMPADFHDKWMDAVRAEAKQADRSVPAPVSQWPRILSIAAVFVFLIGGTFVYRSVRKTILPVSTPAVTATRTEIPVTTDETDMEEAMTEENAMEKDAGGSAGETAYEAAGSAGEASYFSANEAPARKETGKAAEADSAAAGPAANYAGEADRIDKAAEQATEDLIMDTAGETEAESSAEETEEKPAAEIPATQKPETEISVTEIPLTAATEAAPAERSGIGGFFADMGDFLLAVWPYLLIVTVPLAVAAVMKKLRKK